jgi:pimeloyl-ACP methyl ester carboxylesterase
MWDPQFEALGGRFRLIAPDLRGFGNSAPPSDTSGYSLGAFADDAAGLLDRLGVEKVVLGGLSMGGYTAFEFLRRYPERVSAVILADTRPDRDAPAVLERRTAQQKKVAKSGGASLVEAMLPAMLSEETRTARPHVTETLTALMEQSDRSWIGALEAMKNRSDSTGELGALAVPVLIVVGQHDALSAPEVAKDMQERIPQARLVVIEGAGHISNLEAPGAFNAALESFLEGL